MKITQTSVTERRSGIPAQGWENVRAIIEMYASGQSAGYRAAETENLRQVEDSAGMNRVMAVGMYLLAAAQTNQSTLLMKLLSEAEAALTTRGSFYKSYDYDAMGTPFFKANVSIERIDPSVDMYSVGLYAAYVGDEPEIGLAERLTVPRVLRSCLVETTVEPSGPDAFSFDMEKIVRRLDPVLGTEKIKGIEIAKVMMQANEYDESAKPYVLPSTDGLSISLLPGSVGKRFKYDRDGNKKNLWRRKGSVVTGPLGLDYRSRVPGTKALPSFKIIVSGTNPLWLPKRQDKAIAVAGRIAKALV
jgi:hypothetical protein